MSNKILVTGGAGFIGSHLCDRYVQEGQEVICVDNLISGRKDNIAHLIDSPNFTFLEYDVTKPLPSDGIPQATSQKLTAIFHFASPASPNPQSRVSYMANPIETLMVNSIGTKHMLDLARDNDCQIILASTSEVYGDPEEHPQKEEYWGHVSPNGPRSCYDESKRFLEALSFAYFRKYQTKIKVIRIFNTYGPRMRLDDGRFIPTIVDCILSGKTFRQFGDGSTTRSFCYIDDLIDGIAAVHDRSVVGEVINLGNSQEFTVSEAINVLEKIRGKKLTIEQLPSLPDDPKRRRPDINKAKRLLDWEPKVMLEDGIRRMIDSYQSV